MRILSWLGMGAQNQTDVSDWSRSPARNSAWQDVDSVLLWIPVLLMFFGLIMVYSASIALPDSPKYHNYSRYSFFIKHGLSIGIGFFVAFLGLKTPTETWQKLAPVGLVLAIILLIIVLIPHVGLRVNGARRWLPLGIMNFQPSELMKLAACFYAADFCVRKNADIRDVTKGILPMVVVLGMVSLLLLLEPDMGALMVVAMVTLGVLFLGGVNYKVFAALFATMVAAFATLVIFTPWRAKRIFAYLNPWDEENALGGAYQLTQSLIAFGRGELWGQGLGASVQKMFYLPEAHTDFIMAVIGEEFGLLGVWAVIAAFTLLVYKMFMVAREAMAFERNFQALAVQGIAIWLGVQSFINIGVNMGMLPTKG
ncbi:MAG: putative lipid II flippase FtsW, partial [Hydromonas sp.]|nr:putative lipid II flippase FtsW [Hydromonas sp.]